VEIRKLFPDAVTEVKENGNIKLKIDFDVLKQELSDSLIDDKQERYQMTWPEKIKSVVLANASTTKTLLPQVDKSINFFGTKNIYIEGDNLEALKIIRETYLSKIKVVYIDPPYNTGNDFVYNDNFDSDVKDYQKESGQIDDINNRLVANPDTIGRFHTNWLNMIYPRLRLAKDLLTKDGFILISIDDNEVDNLSKIVAEIFGENNVIGKFIVNSTPNARDYGHIGKMHEYVVFAAKDINYATSHMLPDADRNFKYQDKLGGFNIHPLYNSNVAFTPDNRPNLYYPFYCNPKKNESGFYDIDVDRHDGWIEVYPPKSVKDHVQFVWRWGKPKSTENLNKEIIGYCVNGEFRIVEKMRHSEKIIRSILSDQAYTSRRGTAEIEDLFGKKTFSFPKPVGLIHDLLKATSDEDSIIMDFFSGSATTAEAVFKLNLDDNGKRRFIMVQLPEVFGKESSEYKMGYKTICDMAEDRIKKSGEKLKNDSPLLSSSIDFGIRVFKIDSSNMKEVFYSPFEYKPTLLDNLSSNIKDDRTSLDLLFQTMIELGLSLDSEINSKTINGKTIYIVNNNDLIGFYDKNINQEVIDFIAKSKPLYACFRSDSFNDDSSSVNCEQIFKTISPSTRIKVI